MGRGTLELSEAQERRIARYLRDVGSHLTEMPSEERERALSRLNARIERELTRTGDPVGDEFLDRVLASYGTPASQAARIADSKTTEPVSLLGWSNRLWLGVCSGVARYFNLDPNVVRILAVLLGLIPFVLPILLWSYLGFYLYQYYSVKGRALDPLDPVKVLRNVGGFIAVTAVLHFCARFFLFFIAYAHEQIVNAPIVYPGEWGWLPERVRFYFVVMLAIGMPMAAIAALPVSANWSGTLRKVVQAGVAIYAVILCLGIACAIVGVVIANAGQMPDTPAFDALINLTR